MNQHTEHVEELFVVTTALEALERTILRFDNRCSKKVVRQMRRQYLFLLEAALSLLCEPQRTMASGLVVREGSGLYGLAFSVSNAVAVLGAVSNAGKFAVQERLTLMAADAAIGKGENLFREQPTANGSGGVYL